MKSLLLHSALLLSSTLARISASLTSPSSLPGPSIIAPPLCRPPGPIHPRPSTLATSPLFHAATEKLSSLLDAALSGSIDAGWQGVENTSYSIGVISLSQHELDGDPGVPLWEKHHLSSNRAVGEDGQPRGVGPGQMGRDSQWLVGSLTKVFTDFVLMRSGVDLDRGVGEFLPDLLVGAGAGIGAGAGNGNGEGEGISAGKSRIKWEEITLRMLAGHTSGIVPNYGFSEFYFLKDYFQSLGYPGIPDDDFPKCGVIGLNGDCDKQTLLAGLRDQTHPIAPPSTRPQYSNIAFSLIALALEQATGKNYTTLLDEYIISPFNLTNTILSPGDDTKAVIPPVMNAWGGGYGINAPGGGLVSSLADLSTFLSAILSGTAFLASPLSPDPDSGELEASRTQTRTWLKTPAILTGSPYSAVGMPWEIYRAPNLVPEHPHIVDVYGKGGSAYGYQAQLGVVEEYGIGIVVLTAGGGGGACQNIWDAVLGSVVEVVDWVAREEARENYVKVFGMEGGVTEREGRGDDGAEYGEDEEGSELQERDDGSLGEEGLSCGELDDVPWNVTIVQDVHSLVLQGLWRNGTDMLESYVSIWNVTMGAYVPAFPKLARIYPTDISVEGTYFGPCTDKSIVVVREDWRLDWVLESSGTKSDLPGTGFGVDGASKDNCLSWTWVDWLHYGGEAMDRIVFVRRKDSGEVMGVEVPFLRSGVLLQL